MIFLILLFMILSSASSCFWRKGGVNMGLNVTFYHNYSDNNVLNKSISAIGSAITMNPTKDITILNPEFIIAYNSNLITANYCYVAEFGRYYYCDVAVLTGRRLSVRCSVDALMSFRDSIKKCECNVIRSEKGITYVKDNKLPLSPDQCVLEGILFPKNPFDDTFYYDNNILLTVNGG